MTKLFVLNRILRVSVALIFLLEAGMDGGSLSFSSSADEGSLDKLSPVLKSPNNLMDSKAAVTNLIQFGLRENLRSLLNGHDIEDLDYEKFVKINRESALKEENIYSRRLDAKLPWFFISETYENEGDILVKGRLLHEKKIVTYYVVFRLDKDQDDGFIIKGIYPEDEIERVIKELEKREGRDKLMPSVKKATDEGKSEDRLEKEILIEQTENVAADQDLIYEKKDEKIAATSRLSRILKIIKRTTAILSIVIVIFFSSVIKDYASKGNGHVVDHQEIATEYLNAISLDAMNVLIEVSEKTGFDLRTIIAGELTETDGLSAEEELTPKEKKRMTSSVGAVGAWQLMPATVKEANDLLSEIERKINNGEYIGAVDKGKLEIFEEFGLREGIDWDKIDHNKERYDANYNRRVAAMILTLNKFQLDRLKLVKNKNSKGWHFKVRKPSEEHGFNVKDITFRTQNISLNEMMNALRKGGPDPEGYEHYLGKENPKFIDRYEAFLKVLKGPCFEMVTDIFYKAKGWERNEDRRIEKYEPVEVDQSFYEKMIHIYMELNKNGDMNFILFISLFAGAIAVVARAGKGYEDSRNDVFEKDELFEWVMENRLKRDKEKTDNSAEVSLNEYERAELIEVPVEFPPERESEIEMELISSDELYIPTVIKKAFTLGEDESEAVRNVGIMLCPPVEEYKIYASIDFCPMDEYKYDRVKYSGRFDLRLIRKDKAGEIAKYVLEDIMIHDIDPETVIVQLPMVYDEEDIVEIEKLREAGIRFVTVNVHEFNLKVSQTEKEEQEEERKRYRESVYAIMMLVRKFSGKESSDPMLIYCLKALLERYTEGWDNKENVLDKYLEAITNYNVNISELIKIVLIYQPFERFIDKMGKRWDAKTLVFA